MLFDLSVLELQVIKCINDGGFNYGGWQSWNWVFSGDVFLGGLYFIGFGVKVIFVSVYVKVYSILLCFVDMVFVIIKSVGFFMLQG